MVRWLWVWLELKSLEGRSPGRGLVTTDLDHYYRQINCHEVLAKIKGREISPLKPFVSFAFLIISIFNYSMQESSCSVFLNSMEAFLLWQIIWFIFLSASKNFPQSVVMDTKAFPNALSVLDDLWTNQAKDICICITVTPAIGKVKRLSKLRQ